MIEIRKKGILLKFDEEIGQIHSLQSEKREYIGEKVPIFKMGLRDEAGELETRDVTNMILMDCSATENSFEAIYDEENVTVTIKAEVKDHIEWRIYIHMKTRKIPEWVNFPQIAVPHDLKDNGGTSKLLWGFNEGGIVDDLSYKEGSPLCYREPQYPSIATIPMYPAMVATQFVAYFNEEGGLYFGAHDKEDNLKGIDFYPCGKGIMLHMRHYCGVNYGEDYEMNFPMVMQFFEGEWQDAAQIYRQWFEENKKDGFIPIPENESLPKWYSESPIVIAYPVRGKYDSDIMNPNKLFPYCNALEHIERLEKELNSKIMVLLMHWEGTAPWAPPYVWPPYGGEEELRKYIDALHARGHVLGVYCSGMGWTQYSKRVDNYSREQEFEEKNLKEVMCLSPKQELPYCDTCAGIRAGYDMCPSHPFTTEVLREQAKYMVDAGIDYIQLLDQNHGGNSYFCYSKSHGHPPVPGKWQVEAVRNMLKEIQKETRKVLLGCESAAAESYIPQLLFSDNRFELNYGTGRPIPLYSYLYHEYINNFMGNQISSNWWLDHEVSPENILERMAYSFAAGDMLTLVMDENGQISWNWCWKKLDYLPNQENVKNFARNANAWRKGIGKKYLHTGKMVKPHQVICENNIIIAPEYHSWRHKFEFSKIYTSAWESREGTFGQFLINYNTESVECEVVLPEGTYRLYENDNDFTVIDGGVQTFKVKPLSTILLEKSE